jgi:MFS family permease
VSDIAGRRLVYLLCLAIFFVGSWLVAASPGWPAGIALRVMQLFQNHPSAGFAALYALIAGRVIQAFGAGAMVPVSMALVADLYPPQKRALPLGIIGAVDTAGWVLGHLYGGIMVQFMSWPYLFWINLPVVFVIFCITWWGLTGLPRMDVKGGIDWIGVTLLGAALILLNVGLGAPEVGLEGSALPSPYRRMGQRRGGVRGLPGFSAARARSILTGSSRTAICQRQRRESARRLLHHGGAGQRADLHQRCGRGGHDEGGPRQDTALRLYRADALAAIPGGLALERLGYRSSVSSV